MDKSGRRRRYTARLEVRITREDRAWLLATAAQAGTRPGPLVRQLLRAMLAEGGLLPVGIGAGDEVLRLDLEPADRAALHQQAREGGVSAADLVRIFLWRARHSGEAMVASGALPSGKTLVGSPASPPLGSVLVSPCLLYAAALYGLGMLLRIEGREDVAQATWQESRRWFASLGHQAGLRLVQAVQDADTPAESVN